MIGNPSWKADLELVRRVARKDAEATDEFCERMECVAQYVVALHARSHLRLSDEELLDSIQEVHLNIWKSLSRYAGRSRLESWAYGFCLNQLRRSHRRSHRASPLPSTPTALAETLGEGLDPAELDAPGSELAVYLKHLSPMQARVIRLLFLEDQSFGEAAVALEIKETTVKEHYYRALDKLEGILKPREASR